MENDIKIRFAGITLFAVAFAFVESSVVVYLRTIYYPEGFSFPLRLMDPKLGTIELCREVATIVMLVSVAALAGKSRWQRFAYFMIAFGVWDIFYYIWLKLLVNWPASLFDWDILFLLPLPWIGPIIAPASISVMMIVTGILIALREETTVQFRPSKAMWYLGFTGTALILYSFMRDTNASMQLQLPDRFRYEFFAAGMLSYMAAVWLVFRSRTTSSSKVKDQ